MDVICKAHEESCFTVFYGDQRTNYCIGFCIFKLEVLCGGGLFFQQHVSNYLLNTIYPLYCVNKEIIVGIMTFLGCLFCQFVFSWLSQPTHSNYCFSVSQNGDVGRGFVTTGLLKWNFPNIQYLLFTSQINSPIPFYLLWNVLAGCYYVLKGRFQALSIYEMVRSASQ